MSTENTEQAFRRDRVPDSPCCRGSFTREVKVGGYLTRYVCNKCGTAHKAKEIKGTHIVQRNARFGGGCV